MFHSKRGKVAPQSCDKYDHKLAEGIAVDWLGRNLYTTDFLRAKIEVCPLESCGPCADLVDTLLHKPRAITLHPGKGYVNSFVVNSDEGLFICTVFSLSFCLYVK